VYDSLLIPNINNTLNQDFKHRHLWVKKATGLGVTEFFLRLMAWLCLKDDTYHNAQMCIVTGPNQDIAIKLIKRMIALSESRNIMFADQFERPDFNQMLNVVWNLTNYYHFTPENSKVYVDAANPSSNN
jgi:hypothetical protein